MRSLFIFVTYSTVSSSFLRKEEGSESESNNESYVDEQGKAYVDEYDHDEKNEKSFSEDGDDSGVYFRSPNNFQHVNTPDGLEKNGVDLEPDEPEANADPLTVSKGLNMYAEAEKPGRGVSKRALPGLGGTASATGLGGGNKDGDFLTSGNANPVGFDIYKKAEPLGAVGGTKLENAMKGSAGGAGSTDSQATEKGESSASVGGQNSAQAAGGQHTVSVHNRVVANSGAVAKEGVHKRIHTGPHAAQQVYIADKAESSATVGGRNAAAIATGENAGYATQGAHTSQQSGQHAARQVYTDDKSAASAQSAAPTTLSYGAAPTKVSYGAYNSDHHAAPTIVSYGSPPLGPHSPSSNSSGTHVSSQGVGRVVNAGTVPGLNRVSDAFTGPPKKHFAKMKYSEGACPAYFKKNTPLNFKSCISQCLDTDTDCVGLDLLLTCKAGRACDSALLEKKRAGIKKAFVEKGSLIQGNSVVAPASTMNVLLPFAEEMHRSVAVDVQCYTYHLEDPNTDNDDSNKNAIGLVESHKKKDFTSRRQTNSIKFCLSKHWLPPVEGMCQLIAQETGVDSATQSVHVTKVVDPQGATGGSALVETPVSDGPPPAPAAPGTVNHRVLPRALSFVEESDLKSDLNNPMLINMMLESDKSSLSADDDLKLLEDGTDSSMQPEIQPEIHMDHAYMKDTEGSTSLIEIDNHADFIHVKRHSRHHYEYRHHPVSYDDEDNSLSNIEEQSALSSQEIKELSGVNDRVEHVAKGGCPVAMGVTWLQCLAQCRQEQCTGITFNMESYNPACSANATPREYLIHAIAYQQPVRSGSCYIHTASMLPQCPVKFGGAFHSLNHVESTTVKIHSANAISFINSGQQASTFRKNSIRQLNNEFFCVKLNDMLKPGRHPTASCGNEYYNNRDNRGGKSRLLYNRGNNASSSHPPQPIQKIQNKYRDDKAKKCLKNEFQHLIRFLIVVGFILIASFITLSIMACYIYWKNRDDKAAGIEVRQSFRVDDHDDVKARDIFNAEADIKSSDTKSPIIAEDTKK